MILLGVADAVLAIQHRVRINDLHCVKSTGKDRKDLVTLVLPYAQGQPPAARELLAASLLMDVFHEAFPCPQK
jgi:hypothetical protein